MAAIFHRKTYMAPEHLVFFIALIFATLAWFGIDRVQAVSDNARLAEVSLRHIESLTHELNAFEERADADRRFPTAEQRGTQTVNLQMRQELTCLGTFLPHSQNLPLLRIAYERYWQAQQDELRLLMRGNRAGADAIAESRVDPAFEIFMGLVADALRRNEGVASRANALANAGTAGILLAAVAAIYILFRRFAQAQQASVLAESRLATHEILRRSNQRFEALAVNASDVSTILSKTGEVEYFTSNAQRLWGYAPEALLHSAAASLAHPDDAGHLQTILIQAAGTRDGESLVTEMRLHRADGTECLSEITLTNLLSEPAVAGIVMTCRNVTERKAFEDQLAHQAFHDTLTGLPNRALFSERLRQALARSRRTQAWVALLFLDLDNFKFVNDSLGHDAGDVLLNVVAKRLQSCVRPGDTVARLGGDEFTLLLEDLADPGEAMGVAERIMEMLHMPVTVAGREILVTGSLGSTLSCGDERTPDDLLRDADTAMYQAKSGGKAHYVVFDQSMNVRAVKRLELEADLRRALDNFEFCIYYQPILLLGSGLVSEVEALVRWEHPTHGLIPPLEFIPLAEETGLIVPLGHWVLKEACRQVKEWQEEQPQNPPLTVSVNLSSRQLHQVDLVDQVAGILQETGLSAASLKLEITESVMMLDTESTIQKLHALKALGIRLAIDDFGTGYSSMSYLSLLPLDTLKIDRSFVSKMSHHAEDAAIVQAIVTLAKTLNLHITSEGIETSEQLVQLQALGCDQGQGYHFARPLPAAEAGAFLAMTRVQEAHSSTERLAA